MQRYAAMDAVDSSQQVAPRQVEAAGRFHIVEGPVTAPRKVSSHGKVVERIVGKVEDQVAVGQPGEEGQPRALDGSDQRRYLPLRKLHAPKQVPEGVQVLIRSARIRGSIVGTVRNRPGV